MASLRVRRRVSALCFLALIAIVTTLLFRGPGNYLETPNEIDCGGEGQIGGPGGNWDGDDLERLRTAGNLTPRCRTTVERATKKDIPPDHPPEEFEKGAGTASEGLKSSEDRATNKKVDEASASDSNALSAGSATAEKRDKDVIKEQSDAENTKRDAGDAQVLPSQQQNSQTRNALPDSSLSTADRDSREAKLKTLVRKMLSEAIARQQQDFKEDETWLTVTLAEEKAKYRKNFVEFLKRKEVHDKELLEWQEKYNKSSEAGEEVPPMPVLSPGPPPAPVNVNNTVVEGLRERLRTTTSGKYRFQVGDAIAIFGLPRTGSTVLFNMVRLLVREVDPNMVSGFGILFDKAREWKAAKVSVVMKLHELAKPKKMIDGKEVLNPWKEADVFEAVLFSHRNPGDQVCSWCHLLGDEKCKPPKEESKRRAILSTFKTNVKQKCHRLMGIQSRLYKNLYPLVLYDFSYENEISAPPSSPFAKNEFDPFNDPRHHRLLSTMTYIRLLLGLDDRIDDMSLVRLAREMSMLRAISVKEKGKHPADWEHPVTLMHHNHVSAYAPGQNLTGVSNALVPSKIGKEDCDEIARALTLDRQCSMWVGRHGRWLGG